MLGGGGLFLHFSLGLFPRDVFLLLWDHPKTSKKRVFIIQEVATAIQML